MRTNLILAIVAAGLAVPTTYTLLTEGIRFTRYDSIPLLFEGFNPETVAYVILQQAKRGDDGKPVVGEDGKPALDRLVLAKDGDAWTVAEGPLAGLPVRPNAPEDVATKILDHVKRIRRDADKLILAQAKDEELAERNLTEATGMTVHCLTLEQKPVAQLIVGKDASGGKWGEDVVKGYFVRRTDNKEVVLYDALEATNWSLSIKADDWVDKTLHEFETGKVKTFTLRNPKGSVEFSREGATSTDPANPMSPQWKATKAPEGVGPIKQQEVTNLVSRFAVLRAARFLQPLQGVDPNVAGLEPGEFEVAAETEDGKVHRLVVGKKIADKPEYHATAESSKYLFAISEWDVTPYERDPKDLFEPPVAPTQPQEGPPKEGAPAAPSETPKEGPPAEAPPKEPPPAEAQKPGSGDPGKAGTPEKTGSPEKTTDPEKTEAKTTGPGGN